MTDDKLIESLRNVKGLEIEVEGTRFKRVESEDHQKVMWYVRAGIRRDWFFTHKAWEFEAIFKLGQDHS